jgi:protein-S-isoprenylcysteine O-methyltransferase Ste14
MIVVVSGLTRDAHFVGSFLPRAPAQEHLSGFLGTLLLFASFWIKLRDEEKLMLQQFPERYAAYRRRAKRIIPFVGAEL